MKSEDVTIKEWNGMKVVKVSEVPGFDKWLSGQTRPVVEGDPDPYDWAYFWDFERYITGLPVTD